MFQVPPVNLLHAFVVIHRLVCAEFVVGLRLELNRKQHEELKEVVEIHRQELLASLQNLVKPRGVLVSNLQLMSVVSSPRSPAIDFTWLTI